MDITLLDLKKGKKAKIKGLLGGVEFKRKLSCLNIRVGKIVKKVATQPLRGPIIIEIDGRKIALGRGMGSKILLEEKE